MGKHKSASKNAKKRKRDLPPGAIIMSQEYFQMLWDYFDRKHGFTDPVQMGDTLALGDRLWATLREAAEEQGCSLPVRHDPVAGTAPLLRGAPRSFHLRLVP
jgi:hypothetical protein